MSAFESRLLAFAGMAQALAQVRRLADTGQADGAHLQPLVESVFRIDAETPAAVYGGASAVAPGLRILRAHFGNQARVLNRISALAAEGIAVVLATHEPGHAFACADTVALMSAGMIVAKGRPEIVLTAEALSALYGVGVRVVMEAGQGICVPIVERAARSLDSSRSVRG